VKDDFAQSLIEIFITIKWLFFLQNTVPTAYLTEKHPYCFLRESFWQAKSCATACMSSSKRPLFVIAMNICLLN